MDDLEIPDGLVERLEAWAERLEARYGKATKATKAPEKPPKWVPPAGLKSKEAVEREGFIYFVAAPATGLVKVGWTGGDPTDRLRNLQTSNGHELRLIASRRGTVAEEGHLHYDLRADNVRAEWFTMSPRIAALIWCLGAGPEPESRFGRIKARARRDYAWLIERPTFEQFTEEAGRRAIRVLERP